MHRIGYLEKKGATFALIAAFIVFLYPGPLTPLYGVML
jgi:hypothetical protein